MTDKKIEALKLALEALEDVRGGQNYDCDTEQCDEAITAIREALAEQPVSKPWVGLTNEEVKHQWEIWRASAPRYAGFAIGIEAKLKEKNT